MHTDNIEWKNTSKSLILSLLMLISALTAGLESFEKPSTLLEEETQLDWNQKNHQPETDIDTWNLTNSTSNFNVGDIVYVEIDSFDLTINNSYSLDWSLDNGSQTGSFSWTAYNSSSSEDVNLSGLSAGTHCISAELFDTSNNSSLDFDYTCFTVNSASTGHVAIMMGNNVYNYGDDVYADFDLWDLTVNDAYDLTWSLDNGSQTGAFSWVASNTWGNEQLNISGLSPGYYCIEATLYDYASNSYLSSDSACFTVNAPIAQVSVTSGQTSYYVGDTVDIYIDSWYLNVNDTYSIYWALTSQNTTLTGSYNWTAYNTSSSEQLNSTGLSTGYYCINVEIFNSSASSLNYDTDCFTINAVPLPEVSVEWLNSTYVLGDAVIFTIDSSNLTLNNSYAHEVLSYDMSNGTQYGFGSYNWTAYSSSKSQLLNLTGLPVGQYCIEAELYDTTNGNWVAEGYDWECFSVTPPPSVEIYALDYYNYVGDLVEIDIFSADLTIYDNYYVDWSLDNGSQNGSFSWQAWANESIETEELSGLSVGSHCLSAEIFDNNNNSLDSDYSCFEVVSSSFSTPQVTVDALNSSYSVGDTVHLVIEMWDLSANLSHLGDWVVYDASYAVVQSGVYYVNNSNYSFQNLNITGLAAGNYYIDSYISITGSMIAVNYTSFIVNAAQTSYPEVDILVNSTYMVGDVVSFTIHSFNLTLNNSYAHESAWYDSSGAQYGFGNTYNWTAYNNYDDRYLNLTGLPVGQYCIETTIYDLTTGSWVGGGSSWECFSVVSNSTSAPTPSVWSWPGEQYYYSGATVEYYIDSSDLIVNDSYTMEWTLTSSVVQSGNYTWNAYTNSSTEQLNFTGLSAGTYCIDAELYDDNGNWLTGDMNCFTVSSDPAPQVSITPGQTNYYVGDTVDIYIDSWDLIIDYSYTTVWSLNNGNIQNTNYTWYAYTNSSTEQLNLTGLSVGYYCIDVELIDSSSGPNPIFADYDSDCFTVNAPEPQLSVNSGQTNYSVGDTVDIYIDSWDLNVSDTYFMGWELALSGTVVQGGGYNWTAYNTSSSEQFNLTGLIAGIYCIEAALSLVDATGTNGLNWNSSCFEVIEDTGTNDSDGDGVSDDMDLCPNTPASETVDANGCSQSQLGNEWIDVAFEGNSVEDGINHWDLATYITINVTMNDLYSAGDYYFSYDVDFLGPNGDSANITYNVNYHPVSNGSSIFIQHDTSAAPVLGGHAFWNGCWSANFYLYSSDSGAAGPYVLEAEHLGEDFTIGEGESCNWDDWDDDGDGVSNSADAFPYDSSEQVDTDGDGIGNNADTDDDGDGLSDALDLFPLDATEQMDTDGDGVGNNADTDDDGDGVGDNSDACNNTAAGETVDDFGCAISIPDTNTSAMAIGIVDSTTGNQIILVVEPTDTVASVKAKIQVELGISPDEQTLMFGTNELDNDDVLADKNIVANSMLYLVLSVEDTAPTCYVYYWLGSAGTPQNDWNWTEMMSGWNEFNAPDNGEFTLALPKGDYFVYFGCWDEQGDEITLGVDGLPEIQEFQADENWVWGWDQFTISDTDVGVQHDMIVIWSSTDFGGNVTIHFKGVETVADSVAESDTGGLPGFPASLALVSLLGAAVILSRRED
jgi:hypothetical protein